MSIPLRVSALVAIPWLFVAGASANPVTRAMPDAAARQHAEEDEKVVAVPGYPLGFRLTGETSHSVSSAAPSFEAMSPTGPTNNVPVTTAPGNQTSLASVPDGAGGAIIAWQDRRNGGNEIYAQHVLNIHQADPSWPANGAILSSGAKSFFALGIVTDGAGGAIVLWEDSTTTIHAQHVRSTGVVDPVWGAAGVTVATTATGSKLINAISDRAGGAFVAWRDSRNGSSNTDIYAMHLTSTGVDPTWPVNGLAVCAASSNQTAPVLCWDGATGAIVVWSDLRTPANSYDLYAQHVRVNSTVDPAWPANGTVVVARATGERMYSTQNIFWIDNCSSDNQGEAVIPDGAGGCLVTWTDGNTTATQDIYVHHVLSSGVVDPSWTSGGVAVCNAVGVQGLSYLVSDGAGGAVVTWADGRNSASVDPTQAQDIYAQHVLNTGAVSGPSNGLAVLTGASAGFPSSTTDGTAGVSVFWMDRRDSVATAYDVYAHHVITVPSLAVDPAVPAGGSALSTAMGDQGSPIGVWNGSVATIVAWYDARSFGANGYDIYADFFAKVTTDVPSVLATRFMLGVVRPNPFHESMTVGFDLPRPARVRLEVFDTSGRRVRTIVSGEQPAGHRDARWDGRSDQGRSLPVGAYMVRMTSEGFTATRLAVLVR